MAPNIIAQGLSFLSSSSDSNLEGKLYWSKKKESSGVPQLLQFGYCLFIEIVTDKLLVLYPVLFISI